MFKKKSSKVILITLIAVILWVAATIIFEVLDVKIGGFGTAALICEILGYVLTAAIVAEVYIAIAVSSLGRIRKNISFVIHTLLTVIIAAFSAMLIISKVTGLFIMIGSITWDCIAFFMCGAICLLAAALLVSTDLIMTSLRFFKASSFFVTAFVLLVIGVIFMHLSNENRIQQIESYTSPDNSVIYTVTLYPSTEECCVYRYHNKFLSEYVTEYPLNYVDKTYFDGKWCEISWDEENRYMIIEYFNQGTLSIERKNIRY